MRNLNVGTRSGEFALVWEKNHFLGELCEVCMLAHSGDWSVQDWNFLRVSFSKQVTILFLDFLLLSGNILRSLFFLFFLRLCLNAFSFCLLTHSGFVRCLNLDLAGLVKFLSELCHEVWALTLRLLDQREHQIAVSKVKRHVALEGWELIKAPVDGNLGVDDAKLVEAHYEVTDFLTKLEEVLFCEILGWELVHVKRLEYGVESHSLSVFMAVVLLL